MHVLLKAHYIKYKWFYFLARNFSLVGLDYNLVFFMKNVLYLIEL